MSNKLKTSIAGEEITQHIAALHVIQDVGSHHRFEIHLSTEDRSGRFKGSLSDVSKKWIGQQMTIFDDDDMFLFIGVVTSVNLSRTRAAETEYVIKGNSNTIYLEDGVNTRSFGEKTLKQIVDEVIKPYQKKFSLYENKPKQGKIKYCVQYRESNFAFLNRLAARYGEWFYSDGGELVFGKPITSNTVELSFLRDITHFNISVRTTPVNFSLKAYDYKKHDTPNRQSNYPSPSNNYAKIALDKSKTDLYPNSASVPINLSMNEEDLDQIKTLRQNVHLTELVVLSGSSTNKKLGLGTVIKLVDTRDELDASGSDDYGEYIIIHVTHQITEQGSVYSNHFEAIPKDAAIPPLSISPDPPTCEMQTAEVVENNDPKGMGRVRVQFIWQKELSGNDAKTPWIRVASPQGGGSKGFYILPEKEDQVLVAFDHNHPERPFVLTGMYHGQAKPEHSHPENYKKVLKTKGGNEIMLDDEKGKESIKIKSPKDIVINAVAGKITLTAKGDIIIQSSSGNVTISAPSSIKLAASDIILEGKKSVSIKTLELKVRADVSADIEAVLIGIKADASTTIKGAMVEVDGAGMTIIKGGMLKLN
jgi:type VI secretion system secreted protein VgrG